jgi:hypothetical protein
METNITDYILIIALIIVGFGILGLNLASFVDKKISQIAVNLPKVVVKIDKDNVCGKQVEHFDNKGLSYKQEFDVQDVKEKEHGEGSIKEQKERLAVTVDSKNNAKTEEIDGTDVKDPTKYPYVWQRTAEDNLAEQRDYGYIGTVIGCKEAKGKKLLQPDQIECKMSNYQTAEDYYRYYYRYPLIPDDSKEAIQGYNQLQYSDNAPLGFDYRIIPQKYQQASNKPPFPANYYFSYVQA